MSSKNSNPLPSSEVFFHSPTPLARQAFLYPLSLGHFFCGETYEVNRSHYDSYLLMYIVSGSGYVSTAEGSCTFRERQAVLIDCYQPHCYGASGDLEFYWIHFDGICARGYVEYLRSIRSFPLTADIRTEQEILQAFSLLLSDLVSEDIAEIRLGKHITDLLTLLSQMTAAGSSQTVKDPTDETAATCAKAAAYMRQNFALPLSLRELAALVSLSPYYFIRRFKAQYGLTPHQYLLSLRLDCARFYLRSTQKTVKEIGFACGFQSENSFCMAFKKQEGVTPTHYRRL